MYAALFVLISLIFILPLPSEELRGRGGMAGARGEFVGRNEFEVASLVQQRGFHGSGLDCTRQTKEV